MAISEKIQLLGKGTYKNIPDELTLKSITTGSELDYVGSEDFDETMLTKILPQCIEENIDPKQLLEVDYYWVLRCLRFINYGPYIHVGAIFCDKCSTTSRGDYVANLETVPCKPLPENFNNSITISKDEFISFNKDIEIHIPTIQELLNSRKDKQFQDAFGHTNRQFARLCYMITAIGGKKMDPVAVRMTLQKELEAADYVILNDLVTNLTDYGLRVGGSIVCPKCQNKEATFVAFIDERFFRPSVDVLRRWAEDRNRRKVENVSGTENTEVRKHN